MTWRTLTAMALAGALALCGCSCDSGNKADAMIRESGERWVLAGEYTTPREKGPPKENWAGTLQLPDGTMTRLVRIPMKTPDGETVLFPTVAYCQPRKVLICERDDIRDAVYSDVWRYDLSTGQSRWIAKGRWARARCCPLTPIHGAGFRPPGGRARLVVGRACLPAGASPSWWASAARRAVHMPTLHALRAQT